MEIIYRAFDGKIFQSPEKCIIYEQTSAIPMYCESGKINDPDAALVVALDNDNSAKAFISRCVEAGSSCEGVEEGDKGVFIWEYSDDSYSVVDPAILGALRHYFKDNP